MLIVTRQPGQRIFVAPDIWITVMDRKTRIGIEAPIETAIQREEVYQRIRGEEHGRGESELR